MTNACALRTLRDVLDETGVLCLVDDDAFETIRAVLALSPEPASDRRAARRRSNVLAFRGERTVHELTDADRSMIDLLVEEALRSWL